MDKQARQIDEAIPGAEVKVGEGIQLVLMKMRYVLILINQVLLQMQSELEKLVPVLQNILILILPFLVILISPVLQI
jgi:hypothetical protein